MWIAGARGRDTNLWHEHGGVLGGGLQREAMRRGLIQFGARIRKEVALALP